MKTIKMASIIVIMLGLTSFELLAGDKYYRPSWEMAQGVISYPENKAHLTQVPYTPQSIVNYDKQHIPWFESTLKPQNLRKEGQGDLLEEIGKFLSGLLSGKN